ncbi:MAG: acyl carrier protein [Bacteroidales bacterium]|nr:acyl carrier protein [Bacteroidales bacterium]
MDNDKILAKLQEIYRDVLDNEDIVLTTATTANDIEEWDSLANVQLVVEIEGEFGIRFTSAEIPSWKNVGDMIACIQGKL